MTRKRFFFFRSHNVSFDFNVVLCFAVIVLVSFFLFLVLCECFFANFRTDLIKILFFTVVVVVVFLFLDAL